MWPLVTALTMAVLLVGVLVDSVPLAVVGIVGSVGAVIGWLRPEPGTERA
jgi:hypothetical protein